MMEEYKKINGFENYSVSSFGNIRNDESGKVLLCQNDKDGYKKITLGTSLSKPKLNTGVCCFTNWN